MSHSLAKHSISHGADPDHDPDPEKNILTEFLPLRDIVNYCNNFTSNFVYYDRNV